MGIEFIHGYNAGSINEAVVDPLGRVSVKTSSTTTFSTIGSGSLVTLTGSPISYDWQLGQVAFNYVGSSVSNDLVTVKQISKLGSVYDVVLYNGSMAGTSGLVFILDNVIGSSADHIQCQAVNISGCLMTILATVKGV